MFNLMGFAKRSLGSLNVVINGSKIHLPCKLEAGLTGQLALEQGAKNTIPNLIRLQRSTAFVPKINLICSGSYTGNFSISPGKSLFRHD